MTYDYDKFVHPLPGGYTVPKDTQLRRVESDRSKLEAFFTTLGDFVVPSSHLKTYYLAYDVETPPKEEEAE